MGIRDYFRKPPKKKTTRDQVSLKCLTCDIDVIARQESIVQVMVDHTFTEDHQLRRAEIESRKEGEQHG